MDSDLPQASYGVVTFLTSQGNEVQGSLLRWNRHLLAFEILDPILILRASEVLSELRIRVDERLVFAGRAVVKNVVSVGAQLVCEASVEEGWLDAEGSLFNKDGQTLSRAFDGFLGRWKKLYRIEPHFKIVLTDMQSFFTDLRLWLEQVELGIRSAPAGDRVQIEKGTAKALGESTTPIITGLFEQFEEAARRVEPEFLPAHSAFAKRCLHSSLLCSPFMYRTYYKPLGYAGDYEMVNMIVRDPLEGSSLFAKLLNLWFLSQAPAVAHRNRLQHLEKKILETTLQTSMAGRPARVLSLGCGPAHEVQQFILDHQIADQASFTLIDFNNETLEYARCAIESVKQRQSRSTKLQVVKKSVSQLLKEASKTVERSPDDQYDLVYCAGLFDYLMNQTCQRLHNLLLDWVRPGGVLLSTNVDSSNPRRITMDLLMDWHLIYRNSQELAVLRPTRVRQDTCSVRADATGVNLFFQVVKPDRE